VAKFKEALTGGLQIVDTRDKLSFSGGHISGSLNIQDNNSFSIGLAGCLIIKSP